MMSCVANESATACVENCPIISSPQTLHIISPSSSSRVVATRGKGRQSRTSHLGIREEADVRRPSTLLVSALCCITAATFKTTFKEIGRGGRHVTAATFKVGMRVRRSSGGARPEADRAVATQ
jgi:hypothetical protein